MGAFGQTEGMPSFVLGGICLRGHLSEGWCYSRELWCFTPLTLFSACFSL